MSPLNRSLKIKRRSTPISLTPLIDVVFILLIFFLLVSTFEEIRSVEIVPPSAQSDARESTADEQSLTILVQGNDDYLVRAESYSLESLKIFLGEQPDRVIFVKTGPNAPLQAIVSLIDLANTLNLSKVSLVQPEK